jgi:hypothetical protein
MMARGQQEYRKPEERSLADLMVGHRVILQYLVGPKLDPDNPDEEVRGQPEAVTGAYWLHASSRTGIEISRSLSAEATDLFFVPWSSILMLNGVSRRELEVEAGESFAIDRQELLERLGDPQAKEDSDVGLDARRYLTYNPDDEEVRQALKQLPRSYQFP